MGKRKKDRLRGKRTHGGGDTKNRRGAGCRGGRGRGGSTKHKFTKYYATFGTKVRLNPKEQPNSITLERLNDLIKDQTVIDLKELNIQRVIGKGNLDKAVTLKNVEYITPTAKEKIEAIGGKIE